MAADHPGVLGPLLAGPPSPDLPVPEVALRIAAGRPVRPVWLNQLGGVTCEIAITGGHWFVKWAPRNSGLDLAAEAARLAWAAAYASVPHVLDQGSDPTGSWLVTSGLPGETAVSDRWKRDPGVAVVAIGEGLRALHEALPVAGCPFSWSAADRLASARDCAQQGLLDPASWHPDHRHLGIDEALALLADAPEVDLRVVCHADNCAPNTLVGEDGRCTGHVDLGRLGLADRWADLAIATWSTVWNYGPGWEVRLLDAYGVRPDPDRTRYYRLLWDLTP